MKQRLKSKSQKVDDFFVAVMQTASLKDESSFPFKMFRSEKTDSWTEEITISSISCSPQINKINQSVTSLLSAKKYQMFCDFDDFLDNPGLDFTNQHIFSTTA